MSSRVIVELDLTDAMLAKAQEEMGSIVGQIAAFIENTAKVKINSGPKTGRVYTQPQNQKGGKLRPYPHTASAPGEAPANWTGQLANSVEHEMTGPASAEVRVGAEHGAALEFGRADGRMAPRPFLQPSVDEAGPVLEKLLNRFLSE